MLFYIENTGKDLQAEDYSGTAQFKKTPATKETLNFSYIQSYLPHESSPSLRYCLIKQEKIIKVSMVYNHKRFNNDIIQLGNKSKGCIQGK